MKKVILSAAFVLATSFAVKAQEIKFGAKAGLNVSTLTGDTPNDISSRTGFHAGGVVEFKFTEKLSLQPELLYSTQGAKQEGWEEGYRYEATYKFDYINIPVLVKYYVIKGLSLEAGPQIGFVINSKLKVKVPGEGSLEVDADDMTKSVDFGLLGGVGYDLPIGVFFQARYNVGLANVIDENNTSTKNGVFQISVGYKF